MLGIAGDVYWKDLETQAAGGEQTSEEKPQRSAVYSHNIR